MRPASQGEISWIGVRRKVSFCFGAFQSIKNHALADFAAPNEFLSDRIRLRRTRKCEIGEGRAL
jgi:hypothetical protein